MRVSALILGVGLFLPAASYAQAPKTPTPAPSASTKPAAPAADKKEVKVPAKVLAAYVGDYEVAPGRILAITLENGSLFGQPGDQEKRQMYAESPTKFFLKEAPVEITFVKDAKGQVTGLTMEQTGRPTREGKKVK